MAIFHLHVGIVSRKTGRSAVASSAYRSGEKLHNERDGITHDYTRKSGVVHTEIILPENAPKEYQDRSVLWNAVERTEKRYDAQTARDIDMALPTEFDRQEQIKILREYINKNFVSQGMCADFAIHDKGDGNPHAHVMLTTRDVDKEGFGGKNRDWNKKEQLEQWREDWADVCNERLKKKDLPERIDHRTLKAQGIDREPTIHEGRNPELIKLNKDILQRNVGRTTEKTAKYMHELKQGYIILDKEISALNSDYSQKSHEAQTLKFEAEEIIERSEQIKTMKEHRNSACEHAKSYFMSKYKFAPEQAGTEAKRLEYRANSLEHANNRLRDKLDALTAEKDIFMLEYQRQKLISAINPNVQKIQDELGRLDKHEYSQGQSVQEQMSRARAERALNLVTERNFQAILEEVEPQQAERLIRQRERELVRELINGVNRGR
jgi:hypothetical protein